MFRVRKAMMIAATLNLGLGLGPLAVTSLHAQAPAQPPATNPAPAPQPPATPAPPPPPAAAPEPAPAPGPQAGPAQPGDAFGEEVMLTAQTAVTMKGNAKWESAFETLVDSFKSINDFIAKQGLKVAGPAMTIYTATDDTGFDYQTAVPIMEAPKTLPQGDIEIGKTPEGKVLKFIHRGSYDAMDTTYEAITNYLDTKQLEAEDSFIEQYVTDPVTTPEDKLVINVLVPVK